MYKFIAIVVATFNISITFCQTENFNCYVPDMQGRIRDHNVDFISLDLDVRFEPMEGKVTGKAYYLFNALQTKVDSVFLDGPGILVQNILLDNIKTRFRSDSAGITVFFDPPLQRNIELTRAQHSLEINYDAYPKRGIYFVGWNNKITDSDSDPTIIRKQIWTQGQGIDNRHWIPSYDGINDKLITSLKITFDENYKVISNGEPGPVAINNDGTATWTYLMPHPHALYLVMLAIGKYDILEYKSKNGLTTTQYYYPGTKQFAEQTYRYSAEIMDFLEMETGTLYPWTTYSNVPVQEFLYGAMENTTATIFSDFFYQDERSFPDKNYVDINAHELTHQWFGDYVTAWSGSSHWLQESFATYYSKKFRQQISGEDAYQWKRREEMNTAFESEQKNNFPVAHSQAGSQKVYQKGSIVLDMLRYITGDEQFKLVIKDYLSSYPYQNVETRDFEMQFMRTLGINLDWFFDEYVYRNGVPEFTITYSKTVDNTAITIQQTHKQTETIHLFKMPVHIQVHYLDGSFDDKRIWIEKETTVFNFPIPEGREVVFVLFDPNSMIYAKVNFQKEYEELKYQAFNSPNMIDRYDAIVLMRNIEVDKKRDDLVQLFEMENFHAIRAEIIAQLSKDENKKSIGVIKNALADKNPLVRRAVINNIESIPKNLEDELELMLNDENFTNIELALNKLCTLNPGGRDKYLELTKNYSGSNNNIRITWLELKNTADGNKSISELVKFSGPDYEFRTRTDAINSLVTLNYCDELVVKNLFNALLTSNNRLSGPARSAITTFKSNPQYSEMIKNYYKSNVWDDWQMRKLAGIAD
ncbi:MAG: M1 family metallopeptidase [Chitinophagales bacterium]